MADTQRDTASILALYADNTSGLISPQDLRDGIVSILGAYGGLRADGSAAQMTGLNSTPTKVTSFTHTLASDGTVVVASAANDNVTPSITATYEIHGELSFIGSASVIYTLEIYIGGVASGIRAQVAQLGTGAEVAASFSGVASIAAAQAVEMRVSCSTASSVLTARAGQLWLKRVS